MAFFIRPSLSNRCCALESRQTSGPRSGPRRAFPLSRNFSLPDVHGFASFWPLSHAKAHRTQQDTQIGCQALQGNLHGQGAAHARRTPAFASMQVGQAEAQTGQIGAGSRFRRCPRMIESAVFVNGRSAGLPRTFEANGTGESADQDKQQPVPRRPARKRAGEGYMPRATNSPASRARRKRVIKASKGYRGRRSKLFRYAKDAQMKAKYWAYRDRKTRKRTFRSLWITRLNAAVRAEGLLTAASSKA